MSHQGLTFWLFGVYVKDDMLPTDVGIRIKPLYRIPFLNNWHLREKVREKVVFFVAHVKTINLRTSAPLGELSFPARVAGIPPPIQL